ncbi:hypothetical protein [Wohlfahrtiimonas larvae]|uniref:Thioredoxin-like fold domain-containing protein n=1 Tax=Wohlfahrtiimonas larvae TaxID=1157986 RepID=A0ABP9MH49_9GAMM|nr:hypothetical protein [Wohlfahrtiimonas larvae]
MKKLIQELKQFYIPPLTNLYFERIALEKIVFRLPLFVRISDPDSWRIKSAYQKFYSFSDIALTHHLENIKAYLSLEQGGSIFEGNRVLSLNEPIPYIEWQSSVGLSASTDLLGKYCLFIDLLDFVEEIDILSQYINAMQSSFNESLQLVLIGSSELSLNFQGYKNLVCIDPDKTTNLSFAERFKFKYKNTLPLFNFSSKPYFLINHQGRLITFFTKLDQQSLLIEIKKYI